MERSHAGVQIRVPATANLMLDSTDRTAGATADNFIISKKNSILNGFFHRLAATEVVLDWGIPNISAALGNNTFTVASSVPSEVTVTVIDGFYTVEAILNALVVALNATTFGVTFVVVNNDTGVYLSGGVNPYTVVPSKLATQLNLRPVVSPEPALGYRVVNPDLRPFTYLDFVSSQLSYNQELKDATTAPSDKNVLLRWYFSYSEVGSLAADGLGFPVLMGYNQFVILRTFPVPKQIRWNASQPVGQLGFEVYGSDDRLVSASVPLTLTGNQFDWLMTLQVSEN